MLQDGPNLCDEVLVKYINYYSSLITVYMPCYIKQYYSIQKCHFIFYSSFMCFYVFRLPCVFFYGVIQYILKNIRE